VGPGKIKEGRGRKFLGIEQDARKKREASRVKKRLREKNCLLGEDGNATGNSENFEART